MLECVQQRINKRTSKMVNEGLADLEAVEEELCSPANGIVGRLLAPTRPSSPMRLYTCTHPDS